MAGEFCQISSINGVFTTQQFLTTFSSVLGTIALVFYTFPYLGIIFAPMSVLYYMLSIYYRRSSVETKRLDSLMRSALYGSYSGMPWSFLS
jgi:membrane protein implicated in regulation of membrane protease activity